MKLGERMCCGSGKNLFKFWEDQDQGTKGVDPRTFFTFFSRVRGSLARFSLISQRMIHRSILCRSKYRSRSSEFIRGLLGLG